MSRIPIRRVSQFDSLSDDEIVEGYRDGIRGKTEPGDNRSFSYWHGWRNGAADGGFLKHDAAMRELAHDYFEQQRKAKQ